MKAAIFKQPAAKGIFKMLALPLALYMVLSVGACTKVVDIDIPESAVQVVVEGTIENDAPPIVILTKSARFFGNVDINNLGSYFIHGATVKVSASDGSSTDLQELCLQNLSLPPSQQQVILNALGFTDVDSAQVPDVCVYTVPDIAVYFLSGTCSFMGKERTRYNLDILAPGLNQGDDSVHVTSSTYIPTAVGIDSLLLRPHSNPALVDSLVGVYAAVSVPDTFGNFLRYKTKRNSEPFYAPLSSSVYDDKLFVGLDITLPLERGQSPNADFDINTATYFWKGDTVQVKWSNIDAQTYDFYFTLESDGGDSPFSSPVKIKSNINNGLGVWAGYATKYYSIIIPK